MSSDYIGQKRKLKNGTEVEIVTVRSFSTPGLRDECHVKVGGQFVKNADGSLKTFFDEDFE